MVKSNKEICEEQLDVLREAQGQWFYNYNVEIADYVKLVASMTFFKEIQEQLRNRLIKEGKL